MRRVLPRAKAAVESEPVTARALRRKPSADRMRSVTALACRLLFLPVRSIFRLRSL
jgi:hypothetical protein